MSSTMSVAPRTLSMTSPDSRPRRRFAMCPRSGAVPHPNLMQLGDGNTGAALAVLSQAVRGHGLVGGQVLVDGAAEDAGALAVHDAHRAQSLENGAVEELFQ